MEKFDKEIKMYPLEGEYRIERAEVPEFSIWYTIYKNSNPYYRFGWQENLKVIEDDNICFWIMKGNERIGGVLMEPNTISGLYLIPPYSDYYGVLAMLTKLLKHWSDPNKKIFTYTILQNQMEYYQRLGYQLYETRRCMIRPTQAFDVSLDNRFEILQPRVEDSEKIISLLVEANKNQTNMSHEALVKEHTANTEFYFKHYSHLELHMKASSIIIDQETQKVAGVCLISSWTDCPLVFELGVSPNYRGRGLAENMLKRAIDALKEQHQFMKLFVTVGNGAQALYHKLGFVGGPEAATLYIPVVSK